MKIAFMIWGKGMGKKLYPRNTVDLVKPALKLGMDQ